ncbi:MAG: KpsF/GutQ family sugar-phosphate isomerase [Elusimicrobia bacterium]|nr:KpsF/GutQ family sugar-phosphate isomerase [Candidatus Liberimonas magnetica]
MATIMESARKTLLIEAQAITGQIKHLNSDFLKAVELIANCHGRLVIMGIGKSGLIGRKISATMSSLGTPSFFVHPSECFHGDIGMIMHDDIVLILSYTGESDEVKKVLPVLKNLGLKLIAMTGKTSSKTWLKADILINCKIDKEACPFNLAPTSSTSAMLALGDALAITVAQKKGFKKESLARFHPGGGIGKKLTVKVKDIMKKGKDNPVISENASVNDALLVMTKTRLGATNIVNGSGRLVGFFTDGDLRRKLQKDKLLLTRPIKEVMTRSPLTIAPDILAAEAAEILRKHKFDNIPVINSKGMPVGVLDERDLLSEGIV